MKRKQRLSDLRNLSVPELQKNLEKNSQDLIAQFARSSQSSTKLNHLKKDIAQINTIINEKQRN